MQMIRWCAFCQEFMGEKEPYSDFSLSHGVCSHCKTKGLRLSEEDNRRVQALKSFADQLFEAGRAGDVGKAAHLVDQGLALEVRPVDILLGFVSPLLSHVGAQWEKGTISVADEHRFTAVCEEMVRIVGSRLQPTQSLSPQVLLCNIDGNYHTLGIRLVSLWLFSPGVGNLVVYPGLPPQDILRLTESLNFRCVAVSISTKLQIPALVDLERALSGLGKARPALIVGGSLVKTAQGQLPSFDEATFTNSFDELLAKVPPRVTAA